MTPLIDPDPALIDLAERRALAALADAAVGGDVTEATRLAVRSVLSLLDERPELAARWLDAGACDDPCLGDDLWRLDVDGFRTILACHPSGWMARWTRSDGTWRGEAFLSTDPDAVTVRLGPIVEGDHTHEAIAAALAALPVLAERQHVRAAA